MTLGNALFYRLLILLDCFGNGCLTLMAGAVKSLHGKCCHTDALTAFPSPKVLESSNRFQLDKAKLERIIKTDLGGIGEEEMAKISGEIEDGLKDT